MDPALRRLTPSACHAPDAGGPTAIAYPINGRTSSSSRTAHHRQRRRPGVARPPDLRWTVNGEPAEIWIRSRHLVVVERGETTDAIDITYK
jgi:hypothetical protein